jgi:hypothetical protein
MSKRGKCVTLWHYLGLVRDHRKKRGVRFSLRSILSLCFAAVLAGRRSLAAIARWAAKLAEKQPHLLKEFGIDRDDTPCHATLHYVFKGLKVRSLESALSAWVKRLSDEKVASHTSIDGKTLRGSRCAEYEGLQLLAAYCEELQGVVAQVAVPRDGNEITAATTLLKGVPLAGTIVTGDAIHCQRKLCRMILKAGGDYFMAVKENQPGLLGDILAVFEQSPSPLRTSASTA